MRAVKAGPVVLLKVRNCAELMSLLTTVGLTHLSGSGRLWKKLPTTLITGVPAGVPLVYH